jgi:hypothetical protein
METLQLSDIMALIKGDPVLMEAMSREYQNKLAHFEEQLALGVAYKNQQAAPNRASNVLVVVENCSKALSDATFRPLLGLRELQKYLLLLNHAVFKARTYRLRGSNNRDSDQYGSRNMREEAALKQAVLEMSDWIGNGEFAPVLSADAVRFLFYAMMQFELKPELVQLWEHGVARSEGAGGAGEANTTRVYLQQPVLSIVLRVAYELKRFTYEEILDIYQLNTKGAKITPELLSCIGKIAIAEGDYTRALDCLELLLVVFEDEPTRRYTILMALLDLHLLFVGDCQDLKIARHFFDKIVEGKLPYEIQLKVPYVQLLLERAAAETDAAPAADAPASDLNAPASGGFAACEYFWRSTLHHFATHTQSGQQSNLRYSNLNNTFFGIFFRQYPTLTEESYAKLKELIQTYTDTKVVDEFFLNTVISNYLWGNKMVLEQLQEYYVLYNVERTPVLYRVCLKKTGSIAEYSTAEIYAKWNELLAFLDLQGFTYIPIADWAALRDATILSPYQAERKGLYLAVAYAYRNYIQDYRTCIRFCKHWTKQREHISDVARLGREGEVFESDVEVEVPQFSHLRENINFGVFLREVFH